MSNLVKKGVAECLGTFILVFMACGTAIVTRANIVATALAFGLSFIATAYSIGHISGCHINPAVSVAMLLASKISIKDFLVYVVAQIIGALIGATLLYTVLVFCGFDLGVNYTFATNGLNINDVGGYFGAILIEVILTFAFVYVVLSTTSKKSNQKMAGLIIGLTLTLVHLIGINITGTSVNPARSIAPALISIVFDNKTTALTQVWVFILAPIFGAALASVLFQFLNKEEE